MMGLGYAAGGAADALTQVLKQKFVEQIQRQKMAEDIRQADMQNAVQQRQLGQGDRRIGLDRDELTQRGAQFNTEAGFKERGLKLDEGAQPVKLKQMEAQTGELLRKPIEDQADRDFTTTRDRTQHNYQMQEINAHGQNVARSAAAAGAPDAKPLPPAVQASIADIDATLHSLDKLEGMLPGMAAKMGPGVARFETFKQGIPGTTADPTFAAFQSETAAIKNNTIRAITGAGLGQAEAERIMAQIPLETDKPEVWKAKAKATRDNAVFIRNRKMELAGHGAPAAPAMSTAGHGPAGAQTAGTSGNADPLGIR